MKRLNFSKIKDQRVNSSSQSEGHDVQGTNRTTLGIIHFRGPLSVGPGFTNDERGLLESKYLTYRSKFSPQCPVISDSGSQKLKGLQILNLKVFFASAMLIYRAACVQIVPASLLRIFSGQPPESPDFPVSRPLPRRLHDLRIALQSAARSATGPWPLPASDRHRARPVVASPSARYPG